MTNRRAFLLGAATALAAPAIVRADSLMRLFVPKPEILTAVGLVTPEVARVVESGLLYRGLTAVGGWTWDGKQVKFGYSAGEHDRGTGSGLESFSRAVEIFRSLRVTPYPDYGIKV